MERASAGRCTRRGYAAAVGGTAANGGAMGIGSDRGCEAACGNTMVPAAPG